ncbi:IS110 family transposase [Dickeya ananatis]|uniref:IS110 family transposase n=2 Tax=Dickeya ananatis TaxID=3061286 RepID=UPI001CE67166|nr:IS110 family transposase [Dickeya zeae]QYM97072.1 IS110 family transposase [Dickeya zeae]
MKTFVGLDVSQKKTSICVIDPDGNKIRMVNVETHPAVIANYLFSEGFDKSKVALETGPLSVWLYHSLKSYGLDVDCIHARHVHAALSMQLNKTDPNDAFGIARLVLSGWYKPVHVKSLECHQQRLILTSREKLVQLRVVVTNQIRGLLKTFGVVLPPGKNSVFERAVIESSPSLETVKPVILMLLDSWEHLSGQIRKFNYMLEKIARKDPVCQILQSVPGVGTLTALSFKTSIDDPSRFRRVSDAGAFLGLTPRKYQSGEIDRNGGISKQGNRMARTLIYEAASCLLTRYGTDSGLAIWANELRRRMSYKKVVVALARKLTLLMLSMWKSGTYYQERVIAVN